MMCVLNDIPFGLAPVSVCIYGKYMYAEVIVLLKHQTFVICCRNVRCRKNV